VKQAWNGNVDWVLGLDLPEAGALVQSRITGSFDKVREVLPQVPGDRFVRIDGRGMRDVSKSVVMEFLKKHAKDRRILIAASTDSSALGAIDAARELRREKDVAVTGQDCISEASEEMQTVSSPLIGTISHEIQSYGPALIHLGLKMLNGGTVAPYNYVEHRIVSKP
jgi:ribose transport system substrate-binding protein